VTFPAGFGGASRPPKADVLSLQSNSNARLSSHLLLVAKLPRKWSGVWDVVEGDGEARERVAAWLRENGLLEAALAAVLMEKYE